MDRHSTRSDCQAVVIARVLLAACMVAFAAPHTYVVEAGGSVDQSTGSHLAASQAMAGAEELQDAAIRGDVVALRVLLEAGIRADASDDTGGTALHASAYSGQVASLRALLQAGAAVDAMDKDGETALHAAADTGQIPALRVLLKGGANVDARNKDGCSGELCKHQLGPVPLH